MSSLPVTMETMYQIVLLFLAAASVMTTSSSPLYIVNFEQIPGPLTNMEVYNDKLYIGGKNRIHVLDMNLDTLTSKGTCNGQNSCDNINKVLVIDKNTETLVACGTGLGGRCDVFNATSLTNLTNENANDILQISTDIGRPAQAMIAQEGHLVIAITFGTGIPENDKSKYKTYNYAITRREMPDLRNFPTSTSRNTGLNLQIITDGSVEDYVIHYISSFQHNGFSYFVTRQKEYVGGDKTVSKLVRLCQNDTLYTAYTDIVIQCKDDKGNTYGIVQNAIITNTKASSSDQMFIGSFSKRDNPSDWVICSIELEDLDKSIVNAKKEFALTCPKEESESTIEEKKKRYLPDSRGPNSCLKNETQFKETEFVCVLNKFFPIFYYAIGTVPAIITAGKKMQQNKGVSTALHATLENDKDLVVMVGTSEGQLILLNYDNSTSKLDVYSVTDVSPGDNIRAIYSTNDEVYILSNNRVHRYSSTNCSEFETCKETIKGRNPLCGWCVFEQKATRKSKCTGSNDPNNWLSSLGDCVKLTVQPAGTKVNTEISITVTASDNIPKNRTGDTYDCVFFGSSFRKSTRASRNGNVFDCRTPSVSSHDINAKLEIRVTPSNVKLAETDFLFYQCNTFNTCKECVSTEGSNCTWSLTKPECVESNQNVGIAHGKVGQCPRLEDNSDLNYIPTGVESAVTIRGSNLPNASSFWCYIEENGHEASIDGDSITCYLTVSLKNSTAHKENKRVVVKYGQSEMSRKDLDDDHNLTVTVYSCVNLAKDCSHCKGLNTSRYKCRWCSGSCQHTNSCSQHEACPAPFIEKITPSDGPVGGKTYVTIVGTNLGTTLSQIDSVKIGLIGCEKNQSMEISENDDFEQDVPNRIECKIQSPISDSVVNIPRNVILTVNKSASNSNVTYTFKKPVITEINPSFGPMAGGTNITISGENFDIGNQNWVVKTGSGECKNVTVSRISNSDTSTIACVTNGGPQGNQSVTLFMDGKLFTNFVPKFEYVSNPNISEIDGKKGGFLKGGTVLTVLGTDMEHAHAGVVELHYGEDKVEEKCVIESNAVTKCLIPEAPQSLRNDVMAKVNRSSNRRKRAACDGCIEVTVTVKLDGVEKDFIIKYVQDPTVQKLSGDGNVLLYETDEHQLILKGDALNLVTTKTDFRVSIGTANCTVFELTRDTLTCKPPTSQPSPANSKNQYPEVEVHVGNIRELVGYLQYKETVELFIIALAAGGGALLILMIIIVVGIVKYKKMGNKARAYEKNLIDMEMEIKTVARQEFLDMHTTMSSVNKNLVEQGFPYHSYQQFACNVMFSVDYLWTEPVVSNGKMTDDERLKANRGMESLESLIYNKFFLVSVISTMENEKRFFIREKSNLAGNLCAVLMGRMDYLDEILKLLMNNLVQDSPARKHKALFRRCESITEKLLSNWLSLCLYPHVKSHSGSPLYLLYMATQKTMESGPIDAVTGDAKYTLSEEKLLKKWSSSMDEDNDQDLKFEAKTLTLNVVVDNGDEIFKCKVLDCDTISQVKNKCLNQIYVNFPASKLPVGANDLELEWHEGFGGTLKLRDEDNTSKREGKWVRLNTLAHYNVKDESNMALIDPHSTDNNLEDYVNLANINMDGVCDGSIDSSQPLTLHDPENPHECEQWHLIKKEEESSKQGKGAITELYLNRLFTTKQSLMEYMRPLFDIILDHDKCPPPTKFLYDYLDELGEKYKVDVETVHAWKSHSYAIRVWASLMKMPNLLFDVSIPSFMDDNLEIISQVFIESFSLSTQKFTKDTPPQKLIFHHERNHYKDRVKEFYKNVKVDPQDSEGFRQYMADVNRLQQATEFNKVSALYRFYKQLKPYFEDIIDNLATNKEASNLQLDRKLEQVIAIMEEDD